MRWPWKTETPAARRKRKKAEEARRKAEREHIFDNGVWWACFFGWHLVWHALRRRCQATEGPCQSAVDRRLAPMCFLVRGWATLRLGGVCCDHL